MKGLERLAHIPLESPPRPVVARRRRGRPMKVSGHRIVVAQAVAAHHIVAWEAAMADGARAAPLASADDLRIWLARGCWEPASDAI